MEMNAMHLCLNLSFDDVWVEVKGTNQKGFPFIFRMGCTTQHLKCYPHKQDSSKNMLTYAETVAPFHENNIPSL